MTIQRLRELIDLAERDGTTQVYLAIDSEGNGYQPLADVGVLYEARGDFYNAEEVPPRTAATRVIVLWPE